jgi:hypothetical protein
MLIALNPLHSAENHLCDGSAYNCPTGASIAVVAFQEGACLPERSRRIQAGRKENRFLRAAMLENCECWDDN